jgi:hypothetical protein
VVGRDSGGTGQPERDARRRAEELVSEHVTGPIAAAVAEYLRAVEERAQAERRIAAAEAAMRSAVGVLRGLPGLSDEVVGRLIQADAVTVRRLARQRRAGDGGADARGPARV